VRGLLQRTGDEAPATSALPRRRFIRNAAAGAAVLGSGTLPALLNGTTARAAAGSRSFVPNDPDLHLARRASWGLTPKLASQVRRMGGHGWLERQLNPRSIDDGRLEHLIATRFPDLTMGMQKAFTTLGGSWDLMFDLGIASIVRAAWSERQLFEVMVDFWSNHLNVTNPSDNVWWSRHDYDRTVIRKHALGKFSQMLAASATHPAMMAYLNNNESTKENPNENYGRELLELHTVGVDGGYDETEMHTSALILTGFGFSWDTGLFEYDADNHYTGHVKVLGFHSANPSASKGRRVGLGYVDYLAHHPATATRIATKLCQRFMTDAPPKALVHKLAQTYLHHDTAIVPVLRQLLRSKAFRDAKGEKVLRPMQDVVSTLRILGIQPDAKGIDGLQGLYWMIDGLSDAPMAWAQPNGYPDTADAWRSAGGQLNRWNTHLSLAAHWWPDELVEPDLRNHLLPKKLPRTYGGLVDALCERLVFRTFAPPHRAALLGFLGHAASDPLHDTDAAVGWRLPYLVALILDSPYHGIR
jgi:uncharacterized protein (DUF1800 family)